MQQEMEFMNSNSSKDKKKEILGNRPLIVNGSTKQFGTFSDSKSAPIHRWFQYPAGFSPRAVEYVLNHFEIMPGQTVYDPFLGTGTTAIVAKNRGIESFGVEAHQFVHKVALVKTSWDYDFVILSDETAKLFHKLPLTKKDVKSIDDTKVPELVRKCFSSSNLKNLLFIRELIKKTDEPYQSLFSLALTCTLRQASGAATGWPYISPKSRIQEKDGVQVFQKQVRQMISDLESMSLTGRQTPAHVILGDARKSGLDSETIDLSFTSPPYLNNYDYADRTRLETYFNGFAENWAEITEKIRTKLVMSATTQISRSKYLVGDIVSAGLKERSPDLAREIQQKVDLLNEKRLQHTGKKSYDILVGQYFNDMLMAISDNYRVLKPGGKSIWIVGDSAPYGVFIPTDKYIVRIAKAIGFRTALVQQLRKRGEKWQGNTQRHHVALSESIITLGK